MTGRCRYRLSVRIISSSSVTGDTNASWTAAFAGVRWERAEVVLRLRQFATKGIVAIHAGSKSIGAAASG